jgi:type-1 restriction enzyme stySPI specificity protein
MLSQLKDRIECVRGVTYKASSDLHPSLDENSITLLRANNIQDGRISFDDVQYVDKSKVKKKQTLRKGDILICASSGSKNLVGKAALVQSDIEATFGAFCCVVRPTEINQYYLGHYFRSATYRRAIEAASTGTNINNLKPDNFRTLLVPEIPEGEQAAIAMKLDCILEQVSLEKSCLHKLDELVKSRFIEMFGDVFGRPEGIGEAELQDIAEVGSSRRVFKNELLEDGVPFYRGTEISALSCDGRVTPSLFISKEHYKRLIAASGKPEVGDLLLPSICPDGQIWCVNTNEPFYFKDGRVLWVRPDRKIVNSVFLRYALGIQFVDNFEQVASGTTFAEMKIFLLKAMKVPIAPMELQEQFASFVRQVDKLEFEAQQAIDKLQTLYDSLAQEYFGD